MDPQELTITVDGLEIRCHQTPFGPEPTYLDGPLLSLGILLGYLVSGDLPGFVEAVERGEEVWHKPAGAWAQPPDDPNKAAEVWRELTGHELGTDVYYVSTQFSRGLYLPRLVLVELARRLLEMRAATPKPPGPWLFVEAAVNHDPAPGEAEVMREVEAHAAELDRLAARPGNLEHAATVAARRRFLLQELAGYGLLTIRKGEHRASWLERWQLPVLLGYQRATLAIAAYWKSFARGELLRDRDAPDGRNRGESVHNSSVSVDWFRLGVPTPSGWDADAWLGFCERALLVAALPDAYEGELEVHHAGFRATVAWRRDDGVNAAVVSGRLLGYQVLGDAVLEAGGLVLPLEATPPGPVPARYVGPLYPLFMLLRYVSADAIPRLADAVERGEVVEHEGLVARPASAADDEAAETWRGLTGRELGADVYEVKISWAKALYLPREVLVEVVRNLLAMRAATPRPAGPWLFVVPALHDEPAEGEEATMRVVEEHAAELDRLAARKRDPESAAIVPAKRRALLDELAGHGILTIDHGGDRAICLDRWKLPVLRGYQDATIAIGLYWRSAARKARLGDAAAVASGSVLGAAVSVDWFRRKIEPPPGWRDAAGRRDPNDWLAFCERTLVDANVGDAHDGEIYIHQGAFRCVIAWRRDDGVHPAVVFARER